MEKDDPHARICGDADDMQSMYANIAAVTSTREEIAILFGIEESRQTGLNEVRAQFGRRIVMSPLEAKRFAIQLNQCIQEYESKYGLLGVQPPSSAIGRETSFRQEPSFSDRHRIPEKANALIQSVINLDVEIGVERSFKIFEKNLLGNRFLMGFEKDAIHQNPHERIMDICERINMPQNFLETLEKKLFDANYVHFGFEENETSCTYKVYLEFWDKIEQEINNKQDLSEQYLLHLGFKWDISDNTKQAITKYTWYPYLPIEGILARVSKILDPHKYEKALKIAKDIVGIASKRISHYDIIYLEVTEENNPRISFDINMYKGNIQLRELSPLLTEMCQHYLIPSEHFHVLYDVIKTKTFGHLSGGIDRAGRDFLSVYYGVNEYTIGTKQGATPRKKSDFYTTNNRHEKAGLLIQVIKDLNVRYGFERSFKVFENTLLANRFLLGFLKDTIKENTHDKVLDLCERINMPEDFLKAFMGHLSEATIVLFGYEQNEKSHIYKAYLEFGERLKEAFKTNKEKFDPFIIHLGFKWDVVETARRSIAKYTCFPTLTVKDILERVSNVFDSPAYGGLLEIAEGIINVAASRIGPEAFIYFEANEENNPRKSFDMNMYMANLLIKELYPYLLEMVRYYSIDDQQFHNLYAMVKNHKFGHLTGGFDREGRDFLTVYFRKLGSLS